MLQSETNALKNKNKTFPKTQKYIQNNPTKTKQSISKLECFCKKRMFLDFCKFSLDSNVMFQKTDVDFLCKHFVNFFIEMLCITYCIEFIVTINWVKGPQRKDGIILVSLLLFISHQFNNIFRRGCNQFPPVASSAPFFRCPLFWRRNFFIPPLSENFTDMFLLPPLHILTQPHT